MKENASKNQDKKTNLSIDEKKIIASFKIEASSFIPNVLNKVENDIENSLIKNDDLSFFRNKIHAESEDIIPNLKNKILKKTKATNPFIYWIKKNFTLTAIVSSCLAIFASTILISTFYFEPWKSNDYSALISLQISPASSTSSQDKGAHNPYTLSFLFETNENGKAIASSLRPNNYSAYLLQQSNCFTYKNDCDSAALAASILQPAYEMGYLEQTSAEVPNKIKVTYFKLNQDNKVSKKKEYRSIFNNVLKRKGNDGIGTYASISFKNGLSDLDLTSYTNLNNRNKFLLTSVYANGFLDEEKSTLDFQKLLNADEEILNELDNTLSAVRRAKLSPYALNSVIRATASMCSSASDGVTSIEKSKEIENLKEELISNIDSFYDGDEKTKQAVKNLLKTDAYYFVELPDQEEKTLPSIYEKYFQIRDHIKENISKETLINILKEEKEIAESEITFFDASNHIENVAPVDPGNHNNTNSTTFANEEGGLI